MERGPRPPFNLSGLLTKSPFPYPSPRTRHGTKSFSALPSAAHHTSWSAWANFALENPATQALLGAFFPAGRVASQAQKSANASLFPFVPLAPPPPRICFLPPSGRRKRAATPLGTQGRYDPNPLFPDALKPTPKPARNRSIPLYSEKPGNEPNRHWFVLSPPPWVSQAAKRFFSLIPMWPVGSSVFLHDVTVPRPGTTRLPCLSPGRFFAGMACKRPHLIPAPVIPLIFS